MWALAGGQCNGWQKCWFARNLAETYLQLSKKMKIWLADSTLNKEDSGKRKSGEKALQKQAKRGNA
jgi:hypothetical protein